MARKKRHASVTRRLHRIFGVGTAVFVVLMVLSGLAINHAEKLQLEQRHVSQPWVLEWYGLDEPDNVVSFSAGGRWLSFAGSQLYFDGFPVSTLANGIGAVFNGNMIIAAGSNELVLLDKSGVLIERVPWDKSGPIESIGLLADKTVLIKSTNQLWHADAQLLHWQLFDKTASAPEWSLSKSAPENVRQAVVTGYRGTGLGLERLLLDLHSGRVFGSAGVLIYDLLALLVGFLAISGLVLWTRGRRNGKRKRNK